MPALVTSSPAQDACPVPAANPLNPKGLKPCCACPETKAARDDCFLKNDASTADQACRDLVQKHIACMRGYGFNV
ncbi:hypothetical protein BOTBODRAFT_63510 [Botryobasidium botryosum FD-172 SS1]|uniref:Uncharacterized protein n=1 Tax=Botryobasidium botryosum (strain FD-172 SS1) TaxID=930990 RepID=A0A067N4A4_BOTB1|nr:hypothetical protein BOTBODRAFT_63510 [Botryobasidium botryosum FD-172 SS1]